MSSTERDGYRLTEREGAGLMFATAASATLSTFLTTLSHLQILLFISINAISSALGKNICTKCKLFFYIQLHILHI